MSNKSQFKQDNSNFVHGMSGTREYKSYSSMRQRCLNPKRHNFKHYGGRGITICDRWLAGFAAFYEDMGPRPKGFTLERKDNNKNYSPDNCKWADQFEQQGNTRVNRLLTLHGETHHVNEWARMVGIHEKAIHCRLARGWSDEKTLTHPLRITNRTRIK